MLLVHCMHVDVDLLLDTLFSVMLDGFYALDRPACIHTLHVLYVLL